MRTIKNFLRLVMVMGLLIGITTAQPGHYQRHKEIAAKAGEEIITGADQTGLYIDYLKGKNVGMVINQPSVIGTNLTLTVDSFQRAGITIKKIFGPEHG